MKLTQDDWIEIYAALELKLVSIREGDYGDGKEAEEWADRPYTCYHAEDRR